MCARGTTELLEGPKVKRLLDLLKESKATLIAVGAGTSHRGIGIAFGDAATEMLHRARAHSASPVISPSGSTPEFVS